MGNKNAFSEVISKLKRTPNIQNKNLTAYEVDDLMRSGEGKERKPLDRKTRKKYEENSQEYIVSNSKYLDKVISYMSNALLHLDEQFEGENKNEIARYIKEKIVFLENLEGNMQYKEENKGIKMNKIEVEEKVMNYDSKAIYVNNDLRYNLVNIVHENDDMFEEQLTTEFNSLMILDKAETFLFDGVETATAIRIVEDIFKNIYVYKLCSHLYQIEFSTYDNMKEAIKSLLDDINNLDNDITVNIQVQATHFVSDANTAEQKLDKYAYETLETVTKKVMNLLN